MRAPFTANQRQVGQFLPESAPDKWLGLDGLKGHAPAVEPVTETFSGGNIDGGGIFHQLRLARVQKQQTLGIESEGEAA